MPNFPGRTHGAEDDLLTIPLEARFSYDADRNMFFLNMEGVTARTPGDVGPSRPNWKKRLNAVGRKVQMVVNYDKGEPRLMDARIFADGLMGLKDDLLTVPLEARFAYDTGRNMFFLNMEGMSLATLDEVESIGTEIEKRLAAIGKKVQMVVNYDNFYLAPDLTDAYVTLVRRLAEHYYVAVTRYTTSSFMRLKLSEQLSNRGLAPHIYESRQEAMHWNGE